MSKRSETRVVVQLCPRCGKRYFTPYGEQYISGVSPPMPALSRVDNKTYICSQCCVEEALEGLDRYPETEPKQDERETEAWLEGDK